MRTRHLVAPVGVSIAIIAALTTPALASTTSTSAPSHIDSTVAASGPGASPLKVATSAGTHPKRTVVVHPAVIKAAALSAATIKAAAQQAAAVKAAQATDTDNQAEKADTSDDSGPGRRDGDHHGRHSGRHHGGGHHGHGSDHDSANGSSGSKG